MSSRRQLIKAVKDFYQQLRNQSATATKEQSHWVLRTLLVSSRRPDWVNSGFVLPTVAMVALVVVLLTTAILFRAFDRSKNASNVRVNQVTLNAATPAIDRAKAKLDKLFSTKGGLPADTPSDSLIYSTLVTHVNDYTFGDETPLKLPVPPGTDISGNTSIALTKGLKTAWMFPVDTKNQGKFDSYVIYGIYFTNPPLNSNNSQFARARNPLEARTLPMTNGSNGSNCPGSQGTIASLVGSNGWIKVNNKRKKSFFVYVATVPITSVPSANSGKYQTYKGNKGFSALEYQQDRTQLAPTPDAVNYEGDLEINPGPTLRLNGRIVTNSNLILGNTQNNPLRFYQVSSPYSCFYEEEYSQMRIGGNVVNGDYVNLTPNDSKHTIDLFQGKNASPNPVDIDSRYTPPNASVTDAPPLVAYNVQAYTQRINLLVNTQMNSAAATDPSPVQVGIKIRTDSGQDADYARRKELELYFKQRTRRVPYQEVAFGADGTTPYNATTSPLKGSGDSLRPPDKWIYPTQPDGITGTGYAGLTLNKTPPNQLIPAASEPNWWQNPANSKKENSLGDRVLIGNNLPEMWWDNTKSAFMSTDPQDTQPITGIVWDQPSGTSLPRTRHSQVQQQFDLGNTERNGEWEQQAATVPPQIQTPTGGLRVVTGAGIYLPWGYTIATSSAADFTTASTATKRIWSDMMPVASNTATDVSNGPGNSISINPKIVLQSSAANPNGRYTPYLRMRATAVYHYKNTGYDQKAPTPIACVSSYYDPTSSGSATNQSTLPDVSTGYQISGTATNQRPLTGVPSVTSANAGSSNNGVSYSAPTKTSADYTNILNYQAQLRYPNGRLVNEPLNTALGHTTLSLSDRSAIDSAICALQILDGSIGNPTDAVIPHGTIRETAFLDARQVKAVHADDSTKPGVNTFTNADGINGDGTGTVVATVAATALYELPKENRQPLEIRATVLDMDLLRRKTIGGTTPSQEYLLPNSGIIYATRDDALPDLSALNPATGKTVQDKENQKSQSAVDFILDPTRRPNAIMIANGERIWREKDYRDAEKGLTLASDLPVYIQGDFNLHGDFTVDSTTGKPGGTQEEFKKTPTRDDTLADDYHNFYQRSDASGTNRNTNFACRPNDPRLKAPVLGDTCSIGDEWRQANILADAVTLLSNNFRLGFRNEGDYDLNNNLGDSASITKFKQNGFSTNNNNVTSANAFNSNPAECANIGFTESGFTTGCYVGLKPNLTTPYPSNVQYSSYINNFVTPVQRRATAPEYLMEICRTLPVYECTSSDWVVGYDTDTSKKAKDLISPSVTYSVNKVIAGTTAKPASSPGDQKYARRVAFVRDASNNLTKDSSGAPIPLGIDASGNIAQYPDGKQPPLVNNALWFLPPSGQTRIVTSQSLSGVNLTDQPLLNPVLQIQAPYSIYEKNRDEFPPDHLLARGHDFLWLQHASNGTTFNAVFAAGDTPARSTEDNGGMQNFVRFLEDWNWDSTTPKESFNYPAAYKARINGGFYQVKNSSYATGPFLGFLLPKGNYDFAHTYASNVNNAKGPYYQPPTRQWGYDVGLLAQAPDWFTQKLVKPPDAKPDEFFREVGKDDPWVHTLLCAAKGPSTSYDYALPPDQRPTDCPSTSAYSDN